MPPVPSLAFLAGEEHADWLESQLELIGQVGEQSLLCGSVDERHVEGGRTFAPFRGTGAVIVVCVYAVTALVVPLLAPVPISDDWLWARTVQAFVRQGDLQIPDLTAPTLVFQVLWGAAFGFVLGPTFGVLRLSTVVLVLVSGVALYALCRELGISPRRSALALAVYLFNPLSYGLAFTFMSDPHFVALLVVAAFLYVRGLRPAATSSAHLLAGSVVAALAFLVRQPGVLIPVAVAGYLVLTGRVQRDRAGARLLTLVVGIPFLTVVGYQLWLVLVNGVPTGQEDFLGNIRRAGLSGNLRLAGAMAFVSVMYVGFFVFPVALGAVARSPGLIRRLPGRRLLLAVTWALSIVVGLVVMARHGRRMPYAALFLDETGIGPQDLMGGRPPLVTGATGWITGLTALAAVVFGVLLSRPSARSWRGPAGLVAAVMVGQFVGALPSSGQKVIGGVRVITFDRYLLPLLPLSLCLALWALRGIRFPQWVAWAGTAAFAGFSVVGTRDLLVSQEATWALARHANCIGIPNERLDAGHAWTGYHLSDGTYPKRPPRTPQPRPWWVEQLGPVTDSSYRLSTVQLPGHTVLHRREYSQWLHTEPTYLYLSRRQDAPPDGVRPVPRADPDCDLATARPAAEPLQTMKGATRSSSLVVGSRATSAEDPSS